MKTLKPASSIINNLNFNGQPAQEQRVSLPPQAVTIVNNLFNALKSICPAWRNTFTEPAIEQSAKKQWAQAFIENGIANQFQIETGLKKARNYGEPWFPSCGQFIQWCKPNLEDYGLPSADQALRLVIDGKKKTIPAVYVAAKATGSWNLKNLPHKALLPLFTRNYEIACNRVINGEDLGAEIPQALPPKVFVPVSATSEFQAMRQKLKAGNVGEG